MTDKHTCPIAGCGTRIFAGLLMCRRHWGLVPRVLKDEVNRTWRAFSNGSTVEARRAARGPYELAHRGDRGGGGAAQVTHRIVVEIEVVEPQVLGPTSVPLFHVESWGAFGELWLFRGDDGEWRSLAPVAGLDGCRVPDRWCGDLPSLPRVIERAFPEILGGQ